MPQLFIILLKINLVLVLFAATYYFILRRLTFYTINRAFLIFGILFSSVYPFINLTDFFNNQQQINPQVVAFVPELNQKVNEFVPFNFITANWALLSILFYVGVVLMALRLVIQFISLYKMHRKSEPGAIASYKVRILSEPVSPFSFWQTVYINPSLHQEKELQTILAHEQVHVRQWHSLDIMLAELSVVFYWFNPGVWMMKKAVKENLEFITDQKILNKGVDRKTYQYSLLDVGNLNAAVSIVNNFNLSDLKKRIKMMNVKRSSRLNLSRYLLVTPLLLSITLAFTVSKKEIKKHLMPLREVLVENHLISPAKESVLPEINAKNKTRKNKVAMVQAHPDSADRLHFQIKSLVIPNDTLRAQFSGGPDQKHEIVIRGTAVANKVSRNSFFYFIDSAKRGVEVKESELLKASQTTDGQSADKKVIIVRGYKTRNSPDSVAVKGNVVYFLNGRQITEDEFKNSTIPEKIKSVNIRRDQLVTGFHIITKD